MTERNPLPPCLSHLAQLSDSVEIAKLRNENAELKMTVIAFCGPWAVEQARAGGLTDGHLRAHHYDLLKDCGARMVDFVRHPE